MSRLDIEPLGDSFYPFLLTMFGFITNNITLPDEGSLMQIFSVVKEILIISSLILAIIVSIRKLNKK